MVSLQGRTPNRHYDPLQGRFTQVDPIGMGSVSLASPQTLNLYAYCADDPINHTDPSGLGFFSFLKKVFGFFAKIAKWVAIIVAVVVLVAVALQTIVGIEILPVIGDILSSLGIMNLGSGIGALSIAGEGGVAVGIGLGPTSYVLGGLAAGSAANSFQSRRSRQRRRETLGARIARIAFRNINEEAWRTSMPRRGRDGKMHEAGSNKCSTFVFDVIKAAGGPAPTSGGSGQWNATAGEWGNPDVKRLGQWEIVTNGSLRPGDVISKRLPGGVAGATGHVAIIGPNLETIGTGIQDGIISSTNWGTGRNTEDVVTRRCRTQ